MGKPTGACNTDEAQAHKIKENIKGEQTTNSYYKSM